MTGLIDDICREHVAELVRHGIPDGVANMAVQRALGVAKAAVEGLPAHMGDEALVAKVRHELAGTETYARNFVNRVRS